MAPWRLLVTLPRAVLERHRAGRTAELIEHCRGLWHGLWNEPLNLQRLGLQ